MKSKLFIANLLLVLISFCKVFGQTNKNDFARQVFQIIKNNDSVQFKSIHLDESSLREYVEAENVDSNYLSEYNWEYLIAYNHWNKFSLQYIREWGKKQGIDWDACELSKVDIQHTYSDHGNRIDQITITITSNNKNFKIGIRKVINLESGPKILTRLKVVH